MKSSLPLVSIITPSYNQGCFIRQTIDSVLNQDYKNIEYWVIDGGSNDETVNVLKSYGDKINWISEKDRGQTDAINKGMKIIKGNIVAYINSDDFYLPGAIGKVVNYFEENPNVGVLSGGCEVVDGNGIKIQSLISLYKSLLRKFHSIGVLSVANYINQPSTFWRRDSKNTIGVFDEELRYTMDYDYWMRLIKAGVKFGFINDSLSAFRIHGTSKGGSQYIKQFEEELKVQRKYNDSFLLNKLHELHSLLIVTVYRLIK